MCVAGECTVGLDDGHARAEVRLDSPGKALALPPMIWNELRDFTSGAVLLVLASGPYEAGEYIRDYDRVSRDGERLTQIPILDAGAAYRELKDPIDSAVARVLASGRYIGGPEAEAFESAFAAYCEAAIALASGNGLDALHLTLRALGIGPGDEVIVASNGYIATLLAVSMAGATPVLVEPDPATHNLDPAKVEAGNHRAHQSAAADPSLRPAG